MNYAAMMWMELGAFIGLAIVGAAIWWFEHNR